VSDRYRKFATNYFARIARIGFCRWHIVATQKQILLDKKIEPRCGIHTRSPRGSGHGYYFLLRKFLF
jgi:hypothetical protein